MDTKKITPNHTPFVELAASLLTDGLGIQFAPTGLSMRPFIREHDVVTVELARTSLRSGQIALCRRGDGQVILHRIVEVDPVNHRVALQGDAAMSYRESVAMEDVLGIATHVLRKGRLLKIDRSWRGLLGRCWARLRFPRYLAGKLFPLR